MPSDKPPLVIGVAGGTGSGKTTIANAILERVDPERVAYLPHDAYYKDLSGLPEKQRLAVNFDHPDSLDSHLMFEHIQALKRGETIHLPVYDFTAHSRTDESIPVNPQAVIVVEGILIFAEAELREEMDIKIFVDTDADIRFIRRLERDIAERGRTVESVIHQYQSTVRPMHLEFVEPSKRYADVIIPKGGYNQVAMDMVIAPIKTLLHETEHQTTS